jgi:hypothetical protein
MLMGLSASIIRVDMNSDTKAHGVTRPQFLVACPPSLILMKEEERISETSDCKFLGRTSLQNITLTKTAFLKMCKFIFSTFSS